MLQKLTISDQKRHLFAQLLQRTGHKLYNQRYLWLMLLPALIYLILFVYKPLSGWLMAFQNYSPAKGIWGSKWVGL